MWFGRAGRVPAVDESHQVQVQRSHRPRTEACTERSRAVNLSTGLFYVPPGAASLGEDPHICLQHGAPPSINHLLRICWRTVAASKDGVKLMQKNWKHNGSSVRLCRSLAATTATSTGVRPESFITAMELKPSA